MLAVHPCTSIQSKEKIGQMSPKNFAFSTARDGAATTVRSGWMVVVGSGGSGMGTAAAAV